MIKGEITDGRWTAKIEASNNVVDLDHFTETTEYYNPDHELCEPFHMVTYANETCNIKI